MVAVNKLLSALGTSIVSVAFIMLFSGSLVSEQLPMELGLNLQGIAYYSTE